MNGRVIALGGLALGLVALAAAAGAGGVVVVEPWVRKVIERVSRHEGGYDSLNLNRDGAGLSFGILQWAQAPGSLGVLLAEMQKAQSALFASTFGPSASELLAVTRVGSLAPVGGAVLWAEPWVSRFRAAGRAPAFQAVQDELAVRGVHFQGALAVAAFLGIKTERSMALFFDTAVQQGPEKAMAIAREVREQLGAGAPYGDVLNLYARLCYEPFRRTTAPTRPYPSSRLEWRATNGEWHVWAGGFDLYADVSRRRLGIVRDSTLSDLPAST